MAAGVACRRPDDHHVTVTPDARRATLVLSPSASRLREAGARGRVARAVVTALEARGHPEVDVIEAGDPASVHAAAGEAVRGGASVVVLAGGDGTLRDAAGVLGASGAAVGIVPCGTGNLYAASIGVPRDVDAAIRALATGHPRPFDIGEVRLSGEGAADDAIAFVVACGTGFDARVIAATSREAKRRYGVAAYFLAASRLLGHLKPMPTTVTIDGVHMELESVVVLVANTGEAIPGKLRPRLPIAPDDGLLHVFVLPRGGVLGGIQGVLDLMTAEAAGSSPSGAAVRLSGSRVRVEVSPAGPVEVDGDPYPPAALDARVVPGGLRVIRS
jgi:diacylglycerol kinase (ATP)